MTNRAGYHLLLNDMFGQWHETVERARDTDSIVAGEWTFRDIVAHLNGWREWTCRRLEAAASGFVEPNPPWPSGMGEETDERVDALNAWIVSKRQPRDLPHLIAEADDQAARLYAVLDRLSEADLAATPSWLEGNPVSAVIDGCLEHWREHYDDSLRDWINAT